MSIPDDTFSLDRPTRRDVVAAAAKVWNRPVSALIGDCKCKINVEPRMAAAYIMHEFYGYSTTHAGRALGDRDHSTILHAKRTITVRLASGDTKLANRIEQVAAMLENREAVIIQDQVAVTGPEPDIDSIRKLRSMGWSLKSICRRLEVEPRFVAPLIGVHLEELVHANGGVTVRSPERSAVE